MELDLRSLTATSVLGRGAKGVVFLVRSQSETLALKAISRPPPTEEKGDPYRRIRFERDVLRSLRHPLLPSLRGHLSTDAIVAFAMDACPGGDLARLRRAQSEQMFSDDAIRFYAAELVLAIDHLHRLGIVYRDLKPENVLIQESGHIMLVDFDLAVKLPPNDSSSSSSSSNSPSPPLPTEIQRRRRRRRRNRNRRIFLSCFSSSADISPEISVETSSAAAGTTGSGTSQKSNSFVGTEDYVAPEIIKGVGHDFSVDWWSLGVVLYEMLYGRTPFRGTHRKETFYRILAKAPELVGEKTPLRDLIGKLLEKEPEKRIGAEEIKNHDFFRGVVWEEVVEISRPPFIPVGADWEENCGEGEEEIDVEKFVGQVYGTSKEGIVSNSNKRDSFGVF